MRLGQVVLFDEMTDQLNEWHNTAHKCASANALLWATEPLKGSMRERRSTVAVSKRK